MAWDNLTSRDWRRIYHGKYSNLEMLDYFVKINGFSRMHSACRGSNIKRTLETGRHSYHRWYDVNKVPPELDHAKFFKNTKTGVRCLTYNPYFDAYEIREEVKTWAEENGLEAEVYSTSYSWYYPGRTCFIVVHLPGVSILVD